MEYSWVDVKQALEKLKLDSHCTCLMDAAMAMDHQASGLNNPMSEAAVQSTAALGPVYYSWENGRLQAQDDIQCQEALRYRFVDIYAPSEPYRLIKFFIRHPLDPTGSCSPSLKVFADTTLGGVFDWYLSETYEGPGPQMGKDFCLMEIDLANRMLGIKYYHWEVTSSRLRIHDTEWWGGSANSLRITVASSDRIMGNYKTRESQRIFGPCH